MPVYAYACTDCGNAFDVKQSFHEAALTVCDACGGTLRKQYGSVGVTFNGSGFYRTDSRAAAKGSGSGSSSSSSSSSSSNSGSGSSGSSTAGSGSTAPKTSAAPSGGAGKVA